MLRAATVISLWANADNWDAKSGQIVNPQSFRAMRNIDFTVYVFSDRVEG